MSWSDTGKLRRLRRKSLIGQMVLLLLGVQLLFLAGFIKIELPTASQTNLEHARHAFFVEEVGYLPEQWQCFLAASIPELTAPVQEVRVSPYYAVIPVSIFLGYILGVPLGFMACAIYFALGLAGPNLGIFAFASGGGIDYWRQPSFGYLLGLIAGSWLSGRLTMTTRSSWRQLAAIVGGLVLVHATGLVYLIASCLAVLIKEGEVAYMQFQPWPTEQIRNLTWYALPWDFVFTTFLIGIGAPFRWLTTTLIAPDIAGKPKPSLRRELEQAGTK